MRHVEQAWAGIDAGKGHHHVVVLDRDGTRLLSRRVANTEPELIALIDSVVTGAEELTWAIDLADGPAALLIALLMHREQHGLRARDRGQPGRRRLPGRGQDRRQGRRDHRRPGPDAPRPASTAP